jgi:hypothetical protein
MPTNAEQIATIKSQTLAIIVTITANPKPSYDIDGQEVLWSDYLRQLRETIAWCDTQLVAETPVEQHTIGFTG